MAETLTTGRLCQILGCHQKRITELRAKGLPCRKVKHHFQYDAEEVAAWLLAHGHAIRDAVEEPPESSAEPWSEETDETGQILQTRAEVAQFFSVNSHTVAVWLEDPSFPGKPGPRGKREGRFPVIPIARWLLRNKKRGIIPEGLLPDEVKEAEEQLARGEREPSVRDRLTEIKIGKAQIELSRMQGAMVSSEEVAVFFARVCAGSRAILKGLRSSVLQRMPQTLAPEVLELVAEAVDHCTNDVCAAMEELIRGDEDEVQTKRSRT